MQRTRKSHKRGTCILLVALAVPECSQKDTAAVPRRQGRTQAQKLSRQAGALGLWAHCSSLQLRFLLFSCTMGIIITQGQEYITEESYLNSSAGAAETLSTQAAGFLMALSGLMLADLPNNGQDGPVIRGQGVDPLRTKLQGGSLSLTITWSISSVRTMTVQESG